MSVTRWLQRAQCVWNITARSSIEAFRPGRTVTTVAGVQKSVPPQQNPEAMEPSLNPSLRPRGQLSAFCQGKEAAFRQRPRLPGKGWLALMILC